MEARRLQQDFKLGGDDQGDPPRPLDERFELAQGHRVGQFTVRLVHLMLSIYTMYSREGAHRL